MSVPQHRPRGTVLRNAIRFLLGGAFRNWGRNLSATSPAIGSLALLLLFTGVVALAGLALRSVAVQQAQSAAVLHVYLRDGAPSGQVQALQRTLAQDPAVAQVGYTSKQEALRRARQRPGLGGIAGASGSNPFPASFDVQVKRLQDVGAVARLAARSPAVDPDLPTSYDSGAYQRVVTGLTWFAIAGGAFLLLLALIAVAVTQNSIKSAIFARRDEVRVMQLVGARRWMVRGPFLIEGALTGAIAGVAAGIVVGIAGEAALRGAATQTQLLAPGVNGEAVALTAIGLLLVGIVLGAGCSLLGLHRHLER
ncbi:MAG: permease-like cell division protein FtsX [Candidatus Dormiibacterota bacterium]